MQFSQQWLKEWVAFEGETETLAHQLTMAGLEVESIQAVAGEFSQVFVGLVESKQQHPDADKLSVCQVRTDDNTVHQIVCGAANVAAGLKVPVAIVGAVLPGNFKIKKAKLRGVESFGMICSEKELGLAESSDGIMVLPADAPVGQAVWDYLMLDDVSIEVSLTPNRGDCLSVLGIAREVAVRQEKALQPVTIDPIAPQHDQQFPIQVTSSEACPRYVGRVIKGVNAKASTPCWMQERLRRSGLRSISVIVDITNYVMLELGQPMHAFDLAKLAGGIDVRYAKTGETLELLDGKTIELASDNLVIADQNQVLALAGIMGGTKSGVTDDSQDIFLESAFFNPLSIAGKAMQHALHTDSSHRFERGVDPELAVKACERATDLICQIAGGEAGPVQAVIADNHLPARDTIQLRQHRLDDLIGQLIAPEQVTAILQNLGMQVVVEDKIWRVTAPSHRFDILIEEDLIEEVARIYGYDNIAPQTPRMSMAVERVDERLLHESAVSTALVGRGYHEVINYAFVDPRLQQILFPELSALALANPLSPDKSVMRVSLLPGLLNTLIHNRHNQQTRVRLFEWGMVFEPNENTLSQTRKLSMVVMGQAVPEQWGSNSREVDFYDLKGDVECLLASLGIEYSFEAMEKTAFHPGQTACIVQGDKQIGLMAALHPKVLKKLDLSQQVFICELHLEQFMQRSATPAYSTVSAYPQMKRDISFICHADISFNAIEQMIQKTAGEALVNCELFDVYQGEGIAGGQKSLAVGLTYQHPSRTLVDEEVSASVQQVINQLEKDFDISLRE